jgi:hypothetical protein
MTLLPLLLFSLPSLLLCNHAFVIDPSSFGSSKVRETSGNGVDDPLFAAVPGEQYELFQSTRRQAPGSLLLMTRKHKQKRVRSITYTETPSASVSAAAQK